ncbi:MAG: pyridoxal phosphate-dependent aminotransferase [Ruegeria sp.]
MTQPLPHISEMAPYALAEIQVPDGQTLISLSQNECMRPPSPKAIEAAASVLHKSELYPDPDWTELRNAIAAHHQIDASGILCASGSLDLIGCIARVYAGPDRAVLAPAHAYPFFRSAAQLANARFDTAVEVNAAVSVDTLLDAVRPDTGIVFVANPGNPTGTRIARSDLVRLRAGLGRDILLLIDEAYGEFADHLNEPCFDLVQGGNTIVLRTFSKAYGMAGLRVGWGLFPEHVAAEMRKVLNPNNISSASQAAATAAVIDQNYMRETCSITADLRDQATNELVRAGFSVFPSFTNFVLIDLGGSKAANAADAALRAEGVFLRPQSGAGLPGTLRMTIGPQDAMRTAISGLVNWKKETAK